MDADDVHQIGAGFRFGMRGGAASRESLRRSRFRRSQNGQSHRKTLAGDRKENPSRISVHRRGGALRNQRVRENGRRHDCQTVAISFFERTSSPRSSTGSNRYYGGRTQLVRRYFDVVIVARANVLGFFFLRREKKTERRSVGVSGERNGTEGQPSEQRQDPDQFIEGRDTNVHQTFPDNRQGPQRIRFDKRYT